MTEVNKAVIGSPLRMSKKPERGAVGWRRGPLVAGLRRWETKSFTAVRKAASNTPVRASKQHQ
jgi:hypothetical protein